MIAVTFLRPYQMYQRGETAGFDDAVALELIKSKTAFRHGELREVVEVMPPEASTEDPDKDQNVEPEKVNEAGAPPKQGAKTKVDPSAGASVDKS